MAEVNHEQFFDSKGDFNGPYDPYRSHDSEFFKAFFETEYGVSLSNKAKDWLYSFIKRDGIKPKCDAVSMLVAQEFANNTKGNYNVAYLWR